MQEIQQLIADWDAGKIINTLTMGGLGPGYEQMIQICAIEFTRAALAQGLTGLDVPGPAGEDARLRFRASCDKVVEQNPQMKGITGAMFGAASWLAYRWLTGGPEALLAEARARDQADRIIACSKNFPS